MKWQSRPSTQPWSAKMKWQHGDWNDQNSWTLISYYYVWRSTNPDIIQNPTSRCDTWFTWYLRNLLEASFREPAKSRIVHVHNLLEAYIPQSDGTCTSHTSHTEFAARCRRLHTVSRDPGKWFWWERVTTSEKICRAAWVHLKIRGPKIDWVDQYVSILGISFFGVSSAGPSSDLVSWIWLGNYHITFQVSTVLDSLSPKRSGRASHFQGAPQTGWGGGLSTIRFPFSQFKSATNPIKKKQHTMVKSNVMRAATIISRLQSSGDNPEKPGFAHATTDLCDSTTESNP